MNTPKITQTIHPLDGGDYVLGEPPDNPFARIACKTRKLTPTICDGTCMGCKKERDAFLDIEIQRRGDRDALRSGGDPDYECPSPEEIMVQLQRNIQGLEDIKREIIKQREDARLLTEKVNKRMRVLTLLAQSPESNTTLQ